MADMLTVAEIRVARWLKENDAGRIVNIIHDEFLMEIKTDKLKYAAKELSKIMEVEDLFGIPFRTTCKAGNSYGDLVELELEDAA